MNAEPGKTDVAAPSMLQVREANITIRVVMEKGELTESLVVANYSIDYSVRPRSSVRLSSDIDICAKDR